MQVYLLYSASTLLEKKQRDDMVARVTAIGGQIILPAAKFEADDCRRLVEADALVAILDGRCLAPVDFCRLGAFYQLRRSADKPRVLIAWRAAGQRTPAEVNSCFDHLADSAYGLIACLKDFLFLYHRDG